MMSWNISPTVSVLELLWTILAGVGLLVHMVLMVDALRDKAALNATGQNGPRKLIADMNAIDDATRAILQLAFLIVGILAMFNPSTTASGNPSLVSTVAGVVFIGGEMMLVAVSVYNLHGRYKLVSMMLEYGLLDTCQLDTCPLKGHHPAHGEVTVERADDVTTVHVRDIKESIDG
jgi:hypothetical protein